ncbi:hypothetical protein Goarm_022707 [Gossypium armourianum]|uniref:RNase H type-1 domain-containing protein n=1 Tax=Gossypium armourianum TaxID=34283 RepID=A0A7J9KEA9_9ROSI|nr:hypothetical protein [Gossypium armourianum]
MSAHICALPIVQHGPLDQIVWYHNKSGCYYSKSGHSWLILKKMGFGPCGMGDETIIHALWDYPKARAVLSSSGSDGHLLDSAFERCIDWLEDATRLLDLKAFENLIMVLWNIWNSCNNALFWGKEEDAWLIWERARTLGDDFRIFNLSHIVMKPRPPRSQRWVKPLIDVIKINVDAGIHDTVVGIGIIVRDSDGLLRRKP